jgi:TonB family protein
VTKIKAPKAAPRRAEEQAIEPLKNLLKRPSPPQLGDALRRNYPPAARAQGKSGEAKVRAKVEADGSISEVRIMSESSGGFGESCKKTLQQSRWSAPVSKKGTPVATWISYRCSFLVDN